jgi:hypothetical protein
MYMHTSFLSANLVVKAANHNHIITRPLIKTSVQDNAKSKDTVTISNYALQAFNNSMTKSNNLMIDHLQKQKQALDEKRINFISNSLEKGMSAGVIHSQLEDIDKQIQELEEQIWSLQLEDQRKALGMVNKESKKEKQKSKEQQSEINSITVPEEETFFSSHTMRAIFHASHMTTHFTSLKNAQITLRREAKGWEHTDSIRSAVLKRKAEGLNAKMLKMSSEINNDISIAIKKDKEVSINTLDNVNNRTEKTENGKAQKESKSAEDNSTISIQDGKQEDSKNMKL